MLINQCVLKIGSQSVVAAYLGAGSNLLFDPASLFVGGYTGAFYDLTDMASLSQDSAGATPVTAAGQTVGRVADKSGNGLHAIQATAGFRPAWSADAQGRLSLSFDGVDDMLQNATVNITAYPLTICAAAWYPQPSVSASVVTLASSGSADWRQFGTANATNNVEFYERNSGRNKGYPLPVDTSHVLFSEWTASDVFPNIDGESITPVTTDNATFGSGVRIAMGQTRAGVGGFYSGRIYAVLVINKSLSTLEKAQLRQYFSAKSGAPIIPFSSMGDSFTEGVSGANGRLAYNFLVGSSLRAAGVNLRGLNVGVGGHTSSQMFARMPLMIASGTPQIATIYGGMNDGSYGTTVQASPSPTASTFTLGAGLGLKFGDSGVGGYIKVNGTKCKIATISTDAVTLETPLGFTPTAGMTVTHDTQENLERMVAYLRANGCQKILMLGIHYWNYGSGDTISTQSASALTYRTLQSAAATAAGVPYVDLYNLMRAKIVAGTVVQNDWAVWHSALNDPHLSAGGQSEIASHVFAAIQSQGWA